MKPKYDEIRPVVCCPEMREHIDDEEVDEDWNDHNTGIIYAANHPQSKWTFFYTDDCGDPSASVWNMHCCPWCGKTLVPALEEGAS